MLLHIPRLINEEDNYSLDGFPTNEEVHKVIEEMDGNSTAGPDGFNGCFYKNCWDIIKTDFFEVVLEFSVGHEQSKLWTSTLIVPVSKIENPSEFRHLRPISLCNFSNKVLSKFLCTRLGHILQKVISP